MCCGAWAVGAACRLARLRVCPRPFCFVSPRKALLCLALPLFAGTPGAGELDEYMNALSLTLEDGKLKRLPHNVDFPMLGTLSEPRETATVVLNKMYMAPLFAHAVPPTDFLLVLPRRGKKSKHGQASNPYLRWCQWDVRACVHAPWCAGCGGFAIAHMGWARVAAQGRD